ncbi:MAG: class I SAM-dependent methyltransferase [Coriobacteriales bacterium]|jgi:SAM-dependent methyltransferase|nr:class I SAM-dependent methyltransferase [Coriobacteriales bacterium]
MGNKELFDVAAHTYNTPERAKVADAVAEAIRACVKGHSIDASSKTALDYGCGTGLVGLRLLGLFKEVLLMDASPNMVDQARTAIAAIQTSGAAHARVLCGDIMDASPVGLCVDYVVVVQVLLHERDTRGLVSRLRSVLRPGGHLMIVDFDKNERVSSQKVHPGFERGELTALVESEGFSLARLETCYSAKQLFMNQDATLFLLDAVKMSSMDKDDACRAEKPH